MPHARHQTRTCLKDPTSATDSALPIDAVIPALLDALRTNTRCLLVAQPGAGKTTRVPLALLGVTGQGVDQSRAGPLPQYSSGQGKWLLLEPRRVAARLAAGFMAEQLGETLGQTVGFRVRGESKVSRQTRLEVVTQGILTRMLQDDPSLEGVAGIIFDEFHERSLEADLGLALALDAQQGLREDLRLLVMSATLDVGALLQVLGGHTPVIDCPGRIWPVTTHYRSPPLREPAERHQAAVVREALAIQHGNVLVFLPGQAEIRRLHNALLDSLPSAIEICPLHGQLTLAQQQAVLSRPLDGRRRVILSTAIAESSLTVPGVHIVIDAGLERVPVFQPRSGLTSLETRRVNRASADQRRGRAGREAAGHCYRWWAEEHMRAAHHQMMLRGGLRPQLRSKGAHAQPIGEATRQRGVPLTLRKRDRSSRHAGPRDDHTFRRKQQQTTRIEGVTDDDHAGRTKRELHRREHARRTLPTQRTVHRVDAKVAVPVDDRDATRTAPPRGDRQPHGIRRALK